MDYTKLKESRRKKKLERTRRSAEIKSRILIKCIPIFEKYGIKKVILFGSLALGNAGKYSDVDMLVIPLDNNYFWDFYREMVDALEIPLDLYNQEDDFRFIDKIKDRGEVIYEA